MVRQQAALITNVTDDDLGFAGFIVPAGDTVIVPEPTANKMASMNPTKFKRANPNERHRPPRQPITGTGDNAKPAPLPFDVEELELPKQPKVSE